MLELNILVIVSNLIDMSKLLVIKKKISDFNKKIYVSGDKSLSIRWVLFSSIASGISKAKNLLISEDVLAAIEEEMAAVRELYVGGYISKGVYITETDRLYEKAKIFGL